MLNLNLKSTERDVWQFFSEKAGKVRDIQIIKDARSGKSKGVGYVEFYTPTSVMAALALSGQPIMGQPVIIQASQAEKNRAAKAAKQQQAELTEQGPMKLYVGGLVENLASLGEAELRELFSPFGDVVSVDLHRDPYTQLCKGYAFVQFKNAQDAREAMAAMNGFEIAGRTIKVGYATESARADPTAQTALIGDFTVDNERLDDEGGGLMSGVNPRISLMQKLQRIEGPAAPIVVTPSIPQPPQPAGVPPPVMMMLMQQQQQQQAGVPNVCLEPLFTAEEVRTEDVSFLDDVPRRRQVGVREVRHSLKVWIDRKALDGKVWVKFESPEMALRAHRAMAGRFFAGNQIRVSFIAESQWSTVIPA